MGAGEHFAIVVVVRVTRSTPSIPPLLFPYVTAFSPDHDTDTSFRPGKMPEQALSISSTGRTFATK